MASRRQFITGLISFVAAPAIVRAGSLMPIKVMEAEYGLGPMMQAIGDLRHDRILWQIHWDKVRKLIIIKTIVPEEYLHDS